MKIDQLPELTEEEIMNVGMKFMKFMEENKEEIKDQFLKALWEGVGKLDEEAARIVYHEVNKICNGPLFSDVLLESMGIDLDYPFSMEDTMKIYRRAMSILAGKPGIGKIEREGNVLKTCSDIFPRCGCPFVTETPVKMFEMNENQCKYCSKDGFKVWFENLLQKPVEISDGDRGHHGCVHGGYCDNWNLAVQDVEE